MSETLGQLIQRRRQELGLTQEAFAHLLGRDVRQSEISRLERGRVSQPRPDRLRRLAEVLDLPVGVVLMRTDWGTAEPTRPSVSPPAPQEMLATSPSPRSAFEETLQRAHETVARTTYIHESLQRSREMASGSSD